MSRFGWGRVDRQGLRAAILEGDAVLPLIHADASVAAQLVSRAAIDPEARGRFSVLDDAGLGITDAPRWFVPAPERGPFLAVLLNAPDEGVECVLGLVEHATERWAEAAAQGSDEMHPFTSSAPQDPFEAVIEGEPVPLVGDADVMHWCRGGGRISSVLTSSMMALESYLYRRLDGDADITPVLERLTQSRSLAVWGLLVEVARYRPSLLRGPLLPLVSGAAILLADKLFTLHGNIIMPVGLDRTFGERIWLAERERSAAAPDSGLDEAVSELSSASTRRSRSCCAAPTRPPRTRASCLRALLAAGCRSRSS
jgi:hypothetical protein